MGDFEVALGLVAEIGNLYDEAGGADDYVAAYMHGWKPEHRSVLVTLGKLRACQRSAAYFDPESTEIALGFVAEISALYAGLPGLDDTTVANIHGNPPKIVGLTLGKIRACNRLAQARGLRVTVETGGGLGWQHLPTHTDLVLGVAADYVLWWRMMGNEPETWWLTAPREQCWATITQRAPTQWVWRLADPAAPKGEASSLEEAKRAIEHHVAAMLD